jgi:hypothetical protein
VPETEEPTVKHILLMQFSQENTGFAPITEWTQEEVRAHIAFMGTVNQKLADSGEWVDGQGLAMPDQAKIVRADKDGKPLVTDGPFAETKEFVAGWWIVDTATTERAVELAAFISAAPGPGGEPVNMAIEVRQVMEAPPEV